MTRPSAHRHDTPAGIWVRRLCVLFLTAQGIGGLAWWVMLLVRPSTRQWFLPAAAPDVALLAFAVGDLALYAAASLLAAIGLSLRRPWAWPVLAVHCGAATYAGVYCVTLWAIEPTTWLPAAMMAPSLLLVPLITWRLRPGRWAPP